MYVKLNGHKHQFEPDVQKILVLLIEDGELLGGALWQRLRLEGLSTQWVQSCAQAVELFRRTRTHAAGVSAGRYLAS